MRTSLCAIALLATGILIAPSSAPAAFLVSAVESSVLDADGVHYDYSITLKDDAASASPIGTFWFAWIPGQDYMVNAPTSVTSPTGWTSTVTHANTATDGYAIRWVAGAGSLIQPGQSLTFQFTSLETPAQLAGNSPFFPTTPEMTSFVYDGAPFSANSARFVVTPSAAVPEPSSVVLSLLGGLAVVVGGRRVIARVG